MAAGDISKRLAHQVRDILGDLSKSLIPNDYIIYRHMSQLQREWMTVFHTTRQIFEFTITGDGTEYDLDPRFDKLSHYYGQNEDETDITFSIDEHRRKLKVHTANGETKLYVVAFIKPATHASDATPAVSVSDNITSTFDPIIGYEYYDYLVDGVLAMYSTDKRQFKGLDMIYKQVKALSDTLAGTTILGATNIRNTGEETE